MDVNPSNLPTN